VVQGMEDDRIRKVGLELDPEHLPRRGLAALPFKLKRWLAPLRRRLRPGL
jgi:hypothetical protein